MSRNPLCFSLTGDCCLEAGTSKIFNPVRLPQPAVKAGPTVDALYFNQEAVFVSDLITVTDNLKLFGAVRWSRQENRDWFNPEQTLETTHEDSIFAPNLGIIFNPIEPVTLYGSYSQGITTGAQIPLDAANFGLNDGVFLDPTETKQFEASVKADLFRGAAFTAAYFDISQPLATFDESNVFGYVGDQNHRGAEVTLSGEITDALRIIAGGLYLDAEIADPGNPNVNNNRPSGAPELQFNIFADYDVPFVEGLALNSGVFFTGDRFADNLNTFKADGYVRVDLSVRYRFEAADRTLTARLNVRNVADADLWKCGLRLIPFRCAAHGVLLIGDGVLGMGSAVETPRGSLKGTFSLSDGAQRRSDFLFHLLSLRHSAPVRRRQRPHGAGAFWRIIRVCLRRAGTACLD